MFYFAVIGGGIIPIMFLPQDIVQLSKITPNYYMMEGIIRLNQGQPEHALKISMALLAGSVLFFVGTLLFFSRRRVSYEEG
jgi:ABC-type polysaccharide/polyol phosphate export permease